MNTLERHGLLSLLRQTVPYLVASGIAKCPACSLEDGRHIPKCHGLRLLKDIEAALKEVGDGA